MRVRWLLSQGEGRFGFVLLLRSSDRRLSEEYQQASPDSVVTAFHNHAAPRYLLTSLIQ